VLFIIIFCTLSLPIEADVVWSSRRYGLRDVYAEMLHLCRHCNALFWQVSQSSLTCADTLPTVTQLTSKLCSHIDLQMRLLPGNKIFGLLF